MVTGVLGTGPTELAAFDDALRGADVANYNLVRLSSVIPPGSRIVPGAGNLSDPNVVDVTDGTLAARRGSPQGEWGDRLYAVWAHRSTAVPGEEVWAGVAWVQEPSDGRGLFVEHDGPSESQVREDLYATLASISEARGMGHLEHNSVVVGTKCETAPVSALVIAPFQTASW